MEQIQFIVTTLADNYGFDASEAMEYVLSVKREKSPAYARALKAIETTKEKIAKQEEKIANGKIRKLDKAQEKLGSLREKLESQEDKLEEIGKPKERKPRAPKAKKEEVVVEQELKKAEEKPKEKKTKKKEEPKKEEKPESEKAGKRISRMSPMLTDKLKTTFTDFGAEMNDKTKKGFVAYVNDLTQDDFDAKTLTEHMRDYVVLTVRPTDEKEAETLNLKQMQEIKNLIDGYSTGIYWDPTGKRFVTGETDDEEDVIETTFNDKTFMLGENTGRVYENINDEDIFVGYKGIGQFKSM